jgi:Fe-S-cluster containining protein
MIIEPLERNERQTCRYLVPLPGRGLCACSIYDTRPAVCARFPSTVEGASRAGCRGLAPAPYANPAAPS